MRPQPRASADPPGWKRAAIGIFALLMLGAQDFQALWHAVLDSDQSLEPFVVRENATRKGSCRAAACTHETVDARAAELHWWPTDAAYSAPPVQILRPPPDRVIRLMASSFHYPIFADRRYGSSGNYALGSTLPADPALQGNKELHRKFESASPGMVLKGHEAGSGRILDFERTQPSVSQSQWPDPEEVVFDRIEFRPFERVMRLTLASPPPAAVQPGDRVRLHYYQGEDHFLASSDSAVWQWRPTKTEEEAELLEMQALPEGQGWVLEVKPDEYTHEYLLEQRAKWVKRVMKGDAPLIAPQMRIEIGLRHGRGPEQLLQVPATALVKRGADTFVWLLADIFTVPVWVRVLERRGEGVVITERTGALGLPIHPDHWRQLDPWQRARLMRLANEIQNPSLNRILRLAPKPSRFILKPDPALQPGSMARAADDSR